MGIIEVENLLKYYGKFLAVNHISFEVKRGEIFGFLGPNGAGKTTTIRILTGVLKPSGGEVRIFGENVKKNMLRIKQKIGVVPEMANPYVDLTARQNLRLVGRLYGMKKREIENRSDELLKLFNLYERKDDKVKAFSKGMKQRLSLAMAMLPDPELLFLDEPTSGLDVMSARLIKRIIREENQRGKTIFLNTHNMNDANELCNHVAIINHGKIAAIGTPESIKKIAMSERIIHVAFEGTNSKDLKIPSAMEVTHRGEEMVIRTEDVNSAIKEIVEFSRRMGIKIKYISTESPSLEDVFMRIVGDEK